MGNFAPKRSYTYADIGLVPTNKSNIISRKSTEISTDIEINGYKVELPLVLAPMESVVGPKMACIARQRGGLAVLPRNALLETDVCTLDYTQKLMSEYNTLKGCAVSVPATGDYLDRIKALYADGEGATVFCVDVANGYSEVVDRAIDQINYLPFRDKIYLMTGNVGSESGYEHLCHMGVDGVRVGIGGGSVCTTSVATGIGVGQASLVRDCADRKDHRVKYVKQKAADIIADGGIKCPGDVVKAIALGADYVMSGGMFAGCDECPGDVIVHNGQQYKLFSGQASKKVKGTEEFVEGASVLVPAKGTMKKTWKAIEEGLRSGMSYLNKKSIKELRYLPDSNFVILSDAAKAERGVHAIRS